MQRVSDVAGLMKDPRRACAHVLTSIAVAVAAGACDTPIEAPAPAAAPGRDDAASLPAAIPFAQRFGADGAYRLDAAVPLAFRRAVTFNAQKGDESDSRRAADPENYSITAPPDDIASVRPMTEWEPMSALVFAYPSYAALLDQASDTFVEIARYASDYGEVWVLFDGQQAETLFKQKLARANVPSEKIGTVIKFLRTRLETFWFIDYGPLPLIDTDHDTFAFGDFRYYHGRPLDDAIPTVLGRNLPHFGAPAPATTFRLPLTVEGGTFQATRDGVCITGSRQLANMNCDVYDNTCRAAIVDLPLPDLQTHPRALEMRGVLAAYAGCKDLVVTHSISDDGTGHIDMYLKILDDQRILLGDYRAPFANGAEQENAALMNDNATFLEAYVKSDGGRFEVLRLPMPGHRLVQDRWSTYEVPFTYINSTFFNGLNLWPAYTFGDWKDSRAEAEAVWERVLPDMRHEWIDSEELSYQSGAIHCVTRTIPAKPTAPWVGDGGCAQGVCAGAEGGYAGQCVVNGSTDLCWGPAWLCGCHDCRDCPAGEGVQTPCRNVSWRGCCDTGDVLFCDGARLQHLSCAGTGCGWDAQEGYYSCGLGGVDPTGASPVSCVCEPACDGKTCGDDGCDGACGTCAGGSQCVAGACRDDCNGCIPMERGCIGTTSWRCIAGVDDCNTLERFDCASSGLSCDDGGCVAIAVADPEPDRAGGDDTATPGAETAGSSDAADGVPTEGGGGAVTRASADEGCAGGGSGGWCLVLAGFVRVVTRGRYGSRVASLRA